MSWHKPYRTTLIHQAVLVSLLGTASLNAHAVSLGQATVKSSQHEPLSATIEVTDIDAKNFNASLATPDIYQQMGLNDDAKITVTFTPTSDTAGRITLTSTAPISSPFADVVLNLNDNGKQLIEPQTLLMPLPSGSTFSLPEKNKEVIAAETWQNLPVTTTTPSKGETADLDRAETDDSINVMDTPTPKKSSKAERAKLAPENVDTQTNLVAEQVARGDSSYTEEQDDEPAVSVGKATYVVQSGDSLWSIANEIAKANKMRVGDVMKAIHAANPKAFNHGKMNHLKAKASLALPDYEVIPSQKAIEEAINAKRHHAKSDAKATTARKTTKKSASSAKATTAKAAPRRDSRITAKPARKALPKAQVTLVTPTQQGKATGTNHKATPKAVAGGNENLIGTLKNARKQTASSARNISTLNQELSSATQKLQLQNQKLAELEARLRALKSKN